MAGRVSLNVSLTPELADYVREQMRSGRYGSVSEVVRAALRHFASIEPAATAAKPMNKDH